MARIINKLRVSFDRNVKDIKAQILIVGNTGLNPNDGILAMWLDKDDLIHFAAGDDGKWWEIYCFHKHWLDEIIFVLQEFQKLLDKKGK